MICVQLLIFILFLLDHAASHSCNRVEKKETEVCSIDGLFQNETFDGGSWGKNFIFKGDADNVTACAEKVCEEKSASYAFLLDGMCFYVQCSDSCHLKRKSQEKSDKAIIIKLQRTVHVEEVCARKRYMSDEHRLIDQVIRSTNPDARPSLKGGESIQIAFSMKLIQLIDVDELEMTLSLGVWTTQIWKNPLLSWAAKEYGNVSKVNISPELIWTPFLVLYNNANVKNAKITRLGNQVTKVILDSSGVNTWYSSTVFVSSCDINVKYFPFDQQICYLRFGSWTESSDMLDIHIWNESSILEAFMHNAEWEIMDTHTTKKYSKYPCCAKPFAEITFYFHLRRRTLYYVYNLIIPCATLTSLILIGFFLPPGSGEKIILGLTILVAMTVYINIASDLLPTTSDHIPMLSHFYFMLLIEITISVLSAIVCLCLHYRSGEPDPVPDWVRNIFVKKLGFLVNRKLYIPPPGKRGIRHKKLVRFNSAIDILGENKTGNAVNGKEVKCNGSVPHSQRSNSIDLVFRKTNVIEAAYQLKNMAQQRRPMTPERKQLQEELKEDIDSIINHIDIKEIRKTNLLEWQFVSAVVDRIMFYVFFLTLGLSMVAVLCQPVPSMTGQTPE